MKLSICIFAYNQIELVKANIENLLRYEGDDLEIVISDDCSTEPIQELVEQYPDKRLKYYKTPENLGHDLNILHALRKSTGDFAMILISRDTVYANRIGEMIKLLEENKDAAYVLFSATNESGEDKVIMSDRRYEKGKEAAYAHTKLLVHPSGQIYNRKYLDIDSFEKTIRSSFSSFHSYIVHELIRMKLSEYGAFVTSSLKAWKYADTHKAKDVSVIKTKKRVFVHAPEYEIKRYRCQFEFVKKEIKKEEQMVFFENLTDRYYLRITRDFQSMNSDPKLQAHYSFDRIPYSRREEHKRFVELADELFADLPEDDAKHLKRLIEKDHFMVLFYYQVRKKIGTWLRTQEWFSPIDERRKKRIIQELYKF